MLKTTFKHIPAKKIRIHLFSYLAIILFIFFLLLIVTIANPIYERLKQAENRSLRHDVKVRSMTVNEWSRRAVDLAVQVTSRTRIRQELEKYNNKEITLDQLKAFTKPKLADAMNFSKDIIGITRLDSSGIPVVQCGEMIPSLKPSIDYASQFRPFFSSPLEQNGHIAVVVSAPILNRSGSYVGADLVLIDMRQLKRVIDKGEYEIGRTVILGFSSEGMISNVFSGKREEKEDPHAPALGLIKKAIGGESGIDDTPTAFIAAYHTVDIDDWGLAVVSDKSELYKSLHAKLTYWFLNTIIAYFLVLVGFWLLMKPLANRLLLHTDELREKIDEQTCHLEDELRERKRTEASLEKSLVERQQIESELTTALEEAQTRKEETAGLLAASQAILFCRTFEEAARNIFDKCTDIIGAHSGYVAMLSKDGKENEVLFLEAGGLPCDVDPNLPMPIRGLREVAYRTNEVVYDNHFQENEWVKYLPEGHVLLNNILFAPIVRGENTIGLIGMANKPTDFTPRDATIANSFAELATVALTYIQSQEKLKESEERFKALHNASFGGITIHDKGVILECNEGLSTITGYDYEELIGMNGLLLISERTRDTVIQNITSGYEKPYEAEGLRKDGTTYPLRLEARNIPYKGKTVRTVEFRDLTEHKEAEKEKETLQTALTQARKMESIGRLAGGVAHDFNNMLGVIIGNTEILLEDTDPSSPMVHNLEEVLKAAQRSANLTRQLLAFARKQTVIPKSINLNQTIEGMLRMIERLIGEDIGLSWHPEQKLWPTKIDPSQIDQLLVNLCANARDSIKDVGRITIETDNIVLDDHYCSSHPGFRPGDFVMIGVSDNGCGMDKETLNNLFEPFFTTKELGEGTGLGLATVYGIVKQNNGFINVYSEQEQGSTFKIYLPRYTDFSKSIEGETASQEIWKGDGTILLVEDEKAILKMTKVMLERIGYTVLAASNPEEAIKICNTQKQIHLLMTDVVMPSMNGRDLAEIILKLFPGAKCLYMSGYTANVIAHRGILEEGLNFINKPFSRQELSLKLKEIFSKNDS